MTNVRRITPDLSGVNWRTSSYSGGNNECVEVADSAPGIVPVRDSKHPSGSIATFSPAAWRTFLGHLH